MSERDKRITDKGAEADEPFLQRWSRRKVRARQGPVAEEAAPAEAAARSAEKPAPQGGEDAVEPAPPPLPPLESLDENSDYSVFMAAGVSESLRREALRKLFRSAKFNVIDSLDDYCGDYRNYAALGDIVTADMKHHAERLLKAQLEKAGEEDEAARAEKAQASSAEAARGREPERTVLAREDEQAQENSGPEDGKRDDA